MDVQLNDRLNQLLETQILSFSSSKNRELRIKLKLQKKKKGAFFESLFCHKEIFVGFVFYLHVQSKE